MPRSFDTTFYDVAPGYSTEPVRATKRNMSSTVRGAAMSAPTTAEQIPAASSADAVPPQDYISLNSTVSPENNAPASAPTVQVQHLDQTTTRTVSMATKDLLERLSNLRAFLKSKMELPELRLLDIRPDCAVSKLQATRNSDRRSRISSCGPLMEFAMDTLARSFGHS